MHIVLIAEHGEEIARKPWEERFANASVVVRAGRNYGFRRFGPDGDVVFAPTGTVEEF